MTNSNPKPTNTSVAVNNNPKGSSERESLRNEIFSDAHIKRRRETLHFNGVEIEFIQPSVEEIMQLQTAEEDTGEERAFAIECLIRYSYIPGTEEKVFNPDDYDRLAKMPITSEWQRNMEKIIQTMDLGVDKKVKN